MKLLLFAASAAAFSKVVSPDAVALRKQAQQLRDEAAKEEKELLALQGRNNILAVDAGEALVQRLVRAWREVRE